jgi:hypothetical protein
VAGRGRRWWWAAGSAAALAFAAALTGGIGGLRGVPRVRAAAPADVTLEARLLLVGVDGSEPALAAMRAELDETGVPYTVATTSGGPLSASALSDSATHGLYDGVVVVACGAGAGPDAASGAALDAYSAAFGVRSACLYAHPDATFGLGAGNSVDTRASPVTLQYTTAGQSVFGWYATSAPVEVSGVSAMLAPASDAATTPLLVDGAGNAAVAVHRFGDGRELILLTFDQAPGAAHSTQLLGGVAAWLSRGVFLGEKRAYFTAQPDDLFIGTVMTDGSYFRMSGADLRAVAAWQGQVQATAVGAGLRITFPFVGSEVSDSDDLTAAARDVGPQFFFVSHTFDHHRLDVATYDRMTQELTSNDAVMQKYGFGPYDKTSLVTPDISGLDNAPVMQAAVDFGIARIVCDATQSNCVPAAPDTGLPNAVVPAMFMIPRLATNLYANVSTPDQWVSAYNWLNAATLPASVTIDQILESESNTLLTHLLAGDIYPVMFHQANLHAYDGTHTLLTDLTDRLLAKYSALRVLPIVSLQMNEMGARMQDRAARDPAGVSATIHPGKSITVRATAAVRVPVTGAVGAGAETYGAVTISRVTLAAGGEVTLPLAGVAAAGVDGGAGPDGGGVTTGAVGQANASGSSGNGGCSCGLGPDRPADPGPWLSGFAGLAVAAVLLAAARRPRRDVRGAGPARSR